MAAMEIGFSAAAEPNPATAGRMVVEETLPQDENVCENGVEVTQEETDALDVRRDGFRGEWNYTLPLWPDTDHDAVIS